jgi:glutathione S-transferase
MTDGAKKDIERIVEIWTTCRQRFGSDGPLLFGRFSVADAFYAPVVTRFETYAVSLPREAQAYAKAVLELSSMKEWIAAARLETEFVPADEPYANK